MYESWDDLKRERQAFDRVIADWAERLDPAWLEGDLADEMRARWPSLEGIAVVQRVGRLDPGTPTVLIACSAPHRDMGVFEAARYGIDRLKQIVPVWKKEVGSAGAVWVEGDYHPTPADNGPAPHSVRD